jgi:ATP-dependent DNA helicase RecG
MTPLERKIEHGRSPELELLESPANAPTVAPHVVAFLNSGGGTVIIGVDRQGEIMGCENAPAHVERLQGELQQIISPKAFFSVSAESAHGLPVVVIEVVGGRDTPFVTDGTVYLRRACSTVKATGEQLHSLFQLRTSETERWERRVSPVLELGDLDQGEVKKTVNQAEGTGRFSFHNAMSTEAVLQDLGMARGGAFTNAADVCFGRRPATRNPQVRLRAFAFQSDKRGDQYIDQADLNGPVAKIIEEATAFLQRNSALAAQFLPKELQRRNVGAYPGFAIREGLVNALAHRDYSAFSSGATLFVFPDRVEIWNSGQLPKGWSASNLRHNHPSLPTNPDIAHFLFIRNLMEKIGRGTLKMIDACREAGIPAPTWKVDADGITLTLYSAASQQAPVVRLTDRQRNLLMTMQAGDRVRLKDYADRFAADVSSRQALRDLIELRDSGLLQLEGKGRATFYVRTTREWKV